MLRRQAILLLIATLACGDVALAGPGEPPRESAERFLTGLASGDVAAAYDLLFVGSPVVTLKPLQFDTLKRQTEAALPAYGKAIGFELHNEKHFGDSLVRLTYIQRMAQHPLVWRFWFYRPADQWFLSTVVFSDEFTFLQGD